MSILAQFKKAERFKQFARIGIYGASGHGKTYSSLIGAQAIADATGGRVALIDTEKGKSQLYSPGSGNKANGKDEFDFDIVEMSAPFTTERMIEYINAVSKSEEHTVLVIDSLSHVWFGEGGLLDQKNKLAKLRQYNDFTAFAEIKKMYDKLVESIIAANVHIIVTLRAKQAYEITKKEQPNGYMKTNIERVGTAPVFRGDFIYELDLVCAISEGALCTVEKTRYSPYAGKTMDKPDAEFFLEFWRWLDGVADDPYKYGDGTVVLNNPRSRRVFNEYKDDNDGDAPLTSSVLRDWHEARQPKEEVEVIPE